MTIKGGSGNISKTAFDRLSHRVTQMERSMETLQHDVRANQEIAEQALESAKVAAENTAQLLAIANATKGAAAFFTKHGPRIIAFLTGLLAAGEIGDPKIISFLQTFFA